MKKCYIALFLFLFVSWNKINSQCIEYSTANTSKALCNNDVRVVIIDQQGVKWFGTAYGVSKFDNVSWKSFTTSDGLVNNAISDIAVDAFNNKWIATDSGISKYDGKVWVNYTEKNGLIYNYCYSVAIDKNNVVWIGTEKGVSKFDGKTWKSYSTENGLDVKVVTSIAIDEKGFVWCTSPNGIYVYNGTEWTKFNSENSPITDYSTSVFVDKKGIKWVTSNAGLLQFDGLKWKQLDIDKYFTEKFNRALGYDAKGYLWFSGWQKLYRFDGVNWKEFTEADGLPCNIIYSMALEKNGVLWFASLYGALKFDGVKWTKYTTTGGLAHNTIESMIFDKQGNCYIGTLGGFSIFNGAAWTQYSQLNGKSFEVYSIAIDSKNIKWLATNLGLLRFDGKNLTIVGEEANCKYVRIDSRDRVWATYENYNEYDEIGNNLGIYDGVTWTYYRIGEEDLFLSSTTSSSFDIDTAGNIWFSTLYDGIVKYNNFTWTNYNAELSYRALNEIAVDKNNNIWAGSGDGILCYENQSKWIAYDASSDGIDQNNVSSVIVDSRGNIWFDSYNRGIVKYDGKSWFTVTLPSCLSGKIIQSLAVDHQGNLWVGADRLYKLSSLNLNSFEPTISEPATTTEGTTLSNDYSGTSNLVEIADFGYSKHQAILDKVNSLCVEYDPYIRRFSFDDATNTLKWIDKDKEIMCTANINNIKIYSEVGEENIYVDFECLDKSNCITINTQGPTNLTAISSNSGIGAEKIANELNKLFSNLGSATTSYSNSSSSSSEYNANLDKINEMCIKYDQYVRHFTFDKTTQILKWVNKDGDITCTVKIGDVAVYVMDGSGGDYYVRFECIQSYSKCIDCNYGGPTDVSAVTLNNKSGAQQIVDELVKMGATRK